MFRFWICIDVDIITEEKKQVEGKGNKGGLIDSLMAHELVMVIHSSTYPINIG